MNALLDSAAAGWSVILLAVALLGGLVLIPLGLPGLWIMLGGAVLHSFLVPNSGIGLWTLAGCTTLVLFAEFLEFSLSASYTRKYGGSRRASWGAVIGGFFGAFLGIPVPIIGSVIGAFIGAFAGAFVGEMTVSATERGTPHRVATGAVVGRAVAAAAKIGVGLVIGVWILLRALA